MSSGKRRSSPQSGQMNDEFFDISVEGRGLVEHVPISAIRIDSPTEYNSGISRRNLPPGRHVIVDLKNGKWAHGVIHDPRMQLSQHSHSKDYSFDQNPEKHLLTHFPNTPYTPYRSSENSLSYSGMGHTPEAGGLSGMMDAFNSEVRRMGKERERLRDAWYHRKEEEARLGYEREQLRVAMEQTRALRAAEEVTLQKERKRLEAVLRMSAEERERNLEERLFLVDVINSIEQHGVDQLKERDLDHFNHLRDILNQSPSVRRSQKEKDELALIASRLFNEYSFERYSDIVGSEHDSNHDVTQEDGNRLDLSGSSQGVNLATSEKTLGDFVRLQKSMDEEEEYSEEYDVNHYDEDLVYDRGDRVWCWYGDGEWYEANITDIDESGEDHDVYIVTFKEFDVDGFEVLADFLRPLELVRDMQEAEESDEQEDREEEWLEVDDGEGMRVDSEEEEEEVEDQHRSQSQASLRHSEKTLEEFVQLNAASSDESQEEEEVDLDQEEEEQSLRLGNVDNFRWRQEQGRWIQVPIEDIEDDDVDDEDVDDDEEEEQDDIEGYIDQEEEVEGESKDDGYTLNVKLTPGRNLGKTWSSSSEHVLKSSSDTVSEGKTEEGNEERGEEDGYDEGEGSDVEESARPYEEGDLVWALMNSSWYAGVVDSWTVLESGEEVYTISFPGYKGDLGSPSTAEDSYKEGGLLFGDLRQRKEEETGDDEMPIAPRTMLEHQNLSVIFSEGSEEGSTHRGISYGGKEGTEITEVLDEEKVDNVEVQIDSEQRDVEVIAEKEDEEKEEVVIEEVEKQVDEEVVDEDKEVVDEEREEEVVEEAVDEEQDEEEVGEEAADEEQEEVVEEEAVEEEEEEVEEEEVEEIIGGDVAERSESLKTMESIQSLKQEKKLELVEETTKALLPLLLKEQRRMFEEEQKTLRKEESLLVEARRELELATKNSLALGDSATLQAQFLATERGRLRREQERLNTLKAEAEAERLLLKKQREAQEKESVDSRKRVEYDQQYHQQQLHLEQLHLNRLRQERASLSSQRSVHAALYAAAAAAEAESAAEKAARYYRPTESVPHLPQYMSHQSPNSPLSDEESAYYNRDFAPPPYYHQPPRPQPSAHPYHAYHQSVQYQEKSPTEEAVFGPAISSPVRRSTQDSAISSLSQQQTEGEYSQGNSPQKTHYANINHPQPQHQPDVQRPSLVRTLSPPVVVAGGWQPIIEKTEKSSPKKKGVEKRKANSTDSVTSARSTGLDGKELSFSQANVTTPLPQKPYGELEGDKTVIQSKFTATSTASPWWEGGAVRSSKPARVESLESIEEGPKVAVTTSKSVAASDEKKTQTAEPDQKKVPSKVNLTPSSSMRRKKTIEDPAGSSIRDPASVRQRAKEYNDRQRKAFFSPSKDTNEVKVANEDDDKGSLDSPRKWKEESEHKSPQSSPQNKKSTKKPHKETVPPVVSPTSSPTKEVAAKPPMVKHRWKPPPKPIMTWLKKTKKRQGEEEPKLSQSQSVNRLYGQHFKTQAKLEDARHRAEANEQGGPVELVSPKVVEANWHDGRWRQSINKGASSPSKDQGDRHNHHRSSDGSLSIVPVESSVSQDEKELLNEVETLLKHHENKPLSSSVYKRLVHSLQEGGSLASSPALKYHASVQALRDRLAVAQTTPISPLGDASIHYDNSVHSSSGKNKSNWMSDQSHLSPTSDARRADSPSASSLRSSVRSISSGRLRASEELSDDLQELLDQSNAINFLQVQRGASSKMWSHGPSRKKKRRPRPAIRSSAHMTLSNTPPPNPRILKTRLVRHRVKPKQISKPEESPAISNITNNNNSVVE